MPCESDDESTKTFNDLEERQGCTIKMNYLVNGNKFGFTYYISIDTGDRDCYFLLKTMHKMHQIHTDQAKSIRRELEILQSVKHSNIIGLYDWFQTNSYVCLVLEGFEGYSLFQVLNKLKETNMYTLTNKEARSVSLQVFNAISYLHQNEILYRNLCLHSVFVTQNGEVKLIDFMYAKSMRYRKKTSTFCGANNFIAPEIYAGSAYSYPSDWFAFGVLMYYLKTSSYPFSKLTGDRTVAPTFKTLYFPPLCNPSVSRIIKGLLDTDPLHRFTRKEMLKCQWFQPAETGDFEIVSIDVNKEMVMDMKGLHFNYWNTNLDSRFIFEEKSVLDCSLYFPEFRTVKFCESPFPEDKNLKQETLDMVPYRSFAFTLDL